MTYPGELWDIATGKKQGFYYPSVGHPNFSELEQRLTHLETSTLSHPEYFSSLVFPRGMAAISATLESLAIEEKGIFIHHKVMYPSTKKILGKKSEKSERNLVGTKPGIELDLTKPEMLEQKLNELSSEKINVLGVVMEPCCNPTTEYVDVRKISQISHDYDVPVIVDNTFLTPVLLEPFRMGADFVIHSLTKYYSGEGDLMGGVVIAPNEHIPNIKLVRKEKGLTMSTKTANEYCERVLDIEKRIMRHSENASKIAEYLKKIGQVNVLYNNLRKNTRQGLAGGVLSFVFNGDEETAYQRSVNFSEYLSENKGVVKQAVSFAEPKTIVFPWAGQVLNKEFLKSNNIPYGLVRIGVGRDDPVKVADYLSEGIKWSCKK